MKWKELLKGTPRVTPNMNMNTSAHIQKLDLKFSKTRKMLMFVGQVHSSSHNGWYNIEVSFLNVDEHTGLTEDEILQGFMPKPSLTKNDIQVKCTCPTQRFRFDTPDRSNNAGAGKKFLAWHNISHRKPNNPNNIPGVCHHLIEFIDFLKSQGFIH